MPQKVGFSHKNRDNKEIQLDQLKYNMHLHQTMFIYIHSCKKLVVLIPCVWNYVLCCSSL